MEAPRQFAHEAIYDTVERLLADEPRGLLLDVPAGEGALAVRLKQMGFEVRCCDLYPDMFKIEDVDIQYGDLNARLPYDAASLDIVICVEGLEHIENPANAIREFSRLLRPNGTLIVSVPNIMNVEERLKWLFNGYTSHFKPISRASLDAISRDFPEREEIALHINPIGYSEMRYLLESSGFSLVSTTYDKRKRNIWLYAPLTWMIKAATGSISAKKKEERWARELNSNEVLLGGNTLIFKARKK